MRRLLLALVGSLVLAAPAAAGPSIVGGSETAREWPWMGYLDQGRQEIELTQSQYCGGSLVAPTWFLTAAHCIDSELIDPLITTVVIGRHDMTDTGSGERIQAKRILVNDEGGDAALVELARAPATPIPIQVAGPGEEGLYAVGVPATVLGWGATEEGGGGSDVLREAQVPIVSDADCGRAYADPKWGWNAELMICAGYPQGGTDTCRGDSGGPLQVPAGNGTWRLVGLTSFGDGCARAGFPGVYTEAAAKRLRDWIAVTAPGSVAPQRMAPPAPAPPPPPPSSQPAPAPAPPPATAAKPAKKKKKLSCRQKAKRIRSKAKRRAALRRCAKNRRR